MKQETTLVMNDTYPTMSISVNSNQGSSNTQCKQHDKGGSRGTVANDDCDIVNNDSRKLGVFCIVL